MEQKDIQNVGEVVAKQKRPKKSEQMKVQTTPEENSLYVHHVKKLFELPPINTDDCQQVQDRILKYFELCEEDGVKPGVAGLCTAIGIDRSTWNRWENGVRRANTPEYGIMVKRTKSMLEALLEQYTLNGKVNIIAAIFMFKNHFGYTDKQEVVVTPNAPLGDTTDIKALEDQYRDSVPLDVEGVEIDE